MSFIFLLCCCLLVIMGSDSYGYECYLSEDDNMALLGHDYHRVENLESAKFCARHCQIDCACMGFTWFANGTCYFKARTLSSAVVQSQGAQFGLCIDSINPSRDRLWDHVFMGHDVRVVDNVHRNTCRALCRSKMHDDGASIYSWTPTLNATMGMCHCKNSMTGIELRLGATSGFLSGSSL